MSVYSALPHFEPGLAKSTLPQTLYQIPKYWKKIEKKFTFLILKSLSYLYNLTNTWIIWPIKTIVIFNAMWNIVWFLRQRK
jgi:hypothetical protein